VLFNLLDDVFGLDFSFETPQRIFKGLTLLDHNFCHAYSPPFPVDC